MTARDTGVAAAGHLRSRTAGRSRRDLPWPPLPRLCRADPAACTLPGHARVAGRGRACSTPEAPPCRARGTRRAGTRGRACRAIVGDRDRRRCGGLGTGRRPRDGGRTDRPLRLELCRRAQAGLGEQLERLRRVVLPRLASTRDREAVRLGLPPQLDRVLACPPPAHRHETPPCGRAVRIDGQEDHQVVVLGRAQVAGDEPLLRRREALAHDRRNRAGRRGQRGRRAARARGALRSSPEAEAARERDASEDGGEEHTEEHRRGSTRAARSRWSARAGPARSDHPLAPRHGRGARAGRHAAGSAAFSPLPALRGKRTARSYPSSDRRDSARRTKCAIDRPGLDVARGPHASAAGRERPRPHGRGTAVRPVDPRRTPSLTSGGARPPGIAPRALTPRRQRSRRVRDSRRGAG